MRLASSTHVVSHGLSFIILWCDLLYPWLEAFYGLDFVTIPWDLFVQTSILKRIAYFIPWCPLLRLKLSQYLMRLVTWWSYFVKLNTFELQLIRTFPVSFRAPISFTPSFGWNLERISIFIFAWRDLILLFPLFSCELGIIHAWQGLPYSFGGVLVRACNILSWSGSSFDLYG